MQIVEVLVEFIIPGLFLFFAGAIILVLTQGRNEETLVGKILTGIFSLYGIVGTYGIAGFIGDSLSYARLLALGLTTTIIGMAFNIIATIAPNVIGDIVPFLKPVLRNIPPIAAIIIISIMIFGHIFNFVMSIIGSFVTLNAILILTGAVSYSLPGLFAQQGGKFIASR